MQNQHELINFNNLVTVKELAALIKFKERTLYNWINREKGFPHKKWGKRVMFEIPLVIAWLEARNNPAITPTTVKE